MGHAAGELANGLQLLGVTQGLLGALALAYRLQHPCLERGVELAQVRRRPDTLDMRPRAFGDLADQRQVVGRPDPGNTVVDRHQRREPASPHEGHADGGGDADRLEGRGLMRSQLGEVVIDDQRLARAQPLHRQNAEVGEAVVTDDAGRSWRGPVPADGEAVLVGVHVGIGAVGHLEMFGDASGRYRQDGLGVRGLRQGFAETVQESQPTAGGHGGRGLGDSVEHADDHAALVADRAVAEGEIGLVRLGAAAHDKREVFDIGRLAGKGRLGDGIQLIPDLGPDHVETLPKSAGLATEDGDEGVVIEGGQTWPPDDRLREMRSEHQGDAGLEHVGPALDRPKRRRRPVMDADGGSHLAIAAQKLERFAHHRPPCPSMAQPPPPLRSTPLHGQGSTCPQLAAFRTTKAPSVNGVRTVAVGSGSAWCRNRR
jgi:hypothetical protein